MVLNTRATRSFLIAAALVGSGALVAGCGGSSSSGSSRGAGSLLRAADLSSKAVGYKTTMTMQEDVDGTTLNATGTGAFNVKAGEGSMVMRMSAEGQSYAIRAVFTHGIYYMKFPPSLADQIGSGTQWFSFNFNEIGKYENLPGLGSLINSESSENQPGQYLDYLKATRGTSVKSVGQETVQGVQTTHYKASFNLAELPRSVPPAMRADATQLVKAMKQRFHASYSPFDVWIDQAGLVRKFQMSFTEKLLGHSVAITMTEQYTSYGPQPRPSIPSANQTTDLLSYVRGSSGG
jgi:hypothetical protein